MKYSNSVLYACIHAGSEECWKHLLFQFCAPGDYGCLYCMYIITILPVYLYMYVKDVRSVYNYYFTLLGHNDQPM